MKEIGKGYIFETVFWAEKSDSGNYKLMARHINGKLQDRTITTGDYRVIPGQQCKVKVEKAEDAIIQVSYLGLSELAVDDDIYIEDDLKWQFETLLCSGRSVLLEGPQGTGKTTLSRAFASALGMEYVFFNCSVCFEPADFVGSLQLVMDSEGNVKTEWIPTDVLKAVRDAREHPEKRFLVFLDELNRCRSYALNGIMSAIDSSKKLFDPQKNLYIDIPDNIQWIAAINSGNQFTGTFNIDVAQLDRFAIIKLDYPPVDVETDILHKRYGMVKRKDIKKIVQVASKIRHDPDILSDLSVRATDEAVMFLSYPKNNKTVSNERLSIILRTSFCNRLPGNYIDPATEAGIAWHIILRSLNIEPAEEQD